MTDTAIAANPPKRTLIAGLGWTLAVIAVALVGRFATDTSTDWYRELVKPPWQPAAWVFGPVWTSIYLLIVISATLAYRDVGDRRRLLVLGLFAGNLALNLAWTLIFFQARAPGVAVLEIVLLLGTILALIRLVWPHSRVAAVALVPYAAWVTFAMSLNGWIAAHN
jgi:tryptophan-rich sensory protein